MNLSQMTQADVIQALKDYYTANPLQATRDATSGDWSVPAGSGPFGDPLVQGERAFLTPVFDPEYAGGVYGTYVGNFNEQGMLDPSTIGFQKSDRGGGWIADNLDWLGPLLVGGAAGLGSMFGALGTTATEAAALSTEALDATTSLLATEGTDSLTFANALATGGGDAAAEAALAEVGGGGVLGDTAATSMMYGTGAPTTSMMIGTGGAGAAATTMGGLGSGTTTMAGLGLTDATAMGGLGTGYSSSFGALTGASELAGANAVVDATGGVLGGTAAAAAAGTGLTMKDVLSLGQLGTGLYGLSKANDLAKEAEKIADPWGTEGGRALAVEKLKGLISDPNAIFKYPGFNAGMQAVQRAGGAQGWQGSGQMAAGLMQFGQTFYNQALNTMAPLAGAGAQTSPATVLNAQTNANTQIGQSLGLLTQGFGNLGKSFGWWE